MLSLLLTLTYQLPFFLFTLCTGSPSQKFNSPSVETLTLLRNAALSLSFGTVRIRYKQKARQHSSLMSLMNRCFTRLIEGTVRKKTYHTKVRHASKIELKYGTLVRYGTLRLKVRGT